MVKVPLKDASVNRDGDALPIFNPCERRVVIVTNSRCCIARWRPPATMTSGEPETRYVVTDTFAGKADVGVIGI